MVYKIARLKRSLADFSKVVEVFECQGVSLVSVTQQFNTTRVNSKREVQDILLESMKRHETK